MNNIKNSKWYLQIFEAHVSIKNRALEHCLLFALNSALICAKILAFASYRKLLLLGICTLYFKFSICLSGVRNCAMAWIWVKGVPQKLKF